MADAVIVDGDQAVFDPAFGGATVVVQPGRMAGSGPSTAGGKALCVLGDETELSVPGCAYVAGSFAGGVGTITIQQLGPDQIATKVTTGGKPLILKGGSFIARFAVTVPGIDPASGVPDPVAMQVGQGRFVPTVTTVTAQ